MKGILRLVTGKMPFLFLPPRRQGKNDCQPENAQDMRTDKPHSTLP